MRTGDNDYNKDDIVTIVREQGHTAFTLWSVTFEDKYWPAHRANGKVRVTHLDTGEEVAIMNELVFDNCLETNTGIIGNDENVAIKDMGKQHLIDIWFNSSIVDVETDIQKKWEVLSALTGCSYAHYSRLYTENFKVREIVDDAVIKGLFVRSRMVKKVFNRIDKIV